MTSEQASRIVAELLDSWDNWDAEASQAAQVAQCEEAWRGFMAAKLAACLYRHTDIVVRQYINFRGD